MPITFDSQSRSAISGRSIIQDGVVSRIGHKPTRLPRTRLCPNPRQEPRMEPSPLGGRMGIPVHVSKSWPEHQVLDPVRGATPSGIIKSGQILSSRSIAETLPRAYQRGSVQDLFQVTAKFIGQLLKEYFPDGLAQYIPSHCIYPLW